MIKLIIKAFIKNYESINDKKVREAYGILAGVLGIICNLLLFVVKLVIGLLIHSIAVISDSFNNLSDLGSSIITVIGVKMSNRPADPEHPFGHGRIEYISSLIVSFIIITVGLQLLKGSFEKILTPEEVIFSPLLLTILALSVLIKVWMFSYNKYISKKINSGLHNATAFDSLNDAVATGAVIGTTILGHYLPFAIDGFVGLAISLLILYTGYKIAKDTVNLLLGASPNPELVQEINSLVLRGKYIIGTHDLKVHDYGPGRIIASIHAEVLDTVNIVEAHGIIDNLERQISEELGINMIIHIDPLSTDTEETTRINGLLTALVHQINDQYRLDHVRMTKGWDCTNVICSLLVPTELDQDEQKKVRQIILQKTAETNHRLNLVIDSITPVHPDSETPAVLRLVDFK